LEKQPIEVNVVKERKRLIFALILVTIAVNVFIVSIISLEDNFVYYDLVRLGIVAAATILSLVVFAKQGYKGLFGRAYTALMAGLILYLAAEVTWSYYEIGINEEIPFPSLADAFFLAGYAGFGYFQFSLFKFYRRGIKRAVFYIVIPSVIILSFLLLESLISLYDLSNEKDLITVLLSVAYPILDTVIFVPAILIISNSWKGQLTFVPWIFLSWILSGAADILLGYAALPEYQWLYPVLTMIYNAAYLCLTAGLIWYLRFFLSGEQKVLKF